MELELRHIFKKKTQIPHFMKIRPVGAELFHEDGHDERHIITS